MFCSRCGAQIENNLAFCPECGAAIMTDDDKTVAAPIGEKTLKVSYDDPTAVGADATIVADGNNSGTFKEDATLAADTVKNTVSSVKQNSLAQSEEVRPKSKKVIIIAIAAVLLVLIVAVILLFRFKTKESDATASSTALSTEQAIPENVVVIEVPELEGKTLEEAERILGEKITYEVVETYSDDVETGKIVSQFPQGGSQVTPGTLIQITVSLGKAEGSEQNGVQAYIPAEYAVVSPSSLNLMPGQTAKISVKIYPENATAKDYMLVSDDYIVASIGDDNTVMAISAGIAQITVLAPDHTELGTMTVTVKEPVTQPPATQAPTKAPAPDPDPEPTKAPATTKTPTCKVSLDPNGGTVNTASITVRQDGTYGSLPTPTRSGYSFNGWYTTSGAKVTSSSEIAYNYDHTLKAHWTEKAYTSWSTSAPPSNVPSSNIRTRTVYSYRDKETTTSNSKLGSDWILENTASSTGSWSSWSKTKPAESANREIESKKVEDKTTKTQYAYKRYRYYNKEVGVTFFTYGETWAKNQGYSGSWEYKLVDKELSYVKTYEGVKGYGKEGDVWFRADCSKQGTKYTTFKITSTVVSGSHTEYRYRDTTYTYYYYRWSDWSAWSTTSCSKSSTREVKTRTEYSYRPN